MPQLTVIGAGAWGTTIAQLLAAGGHEVTLWARDHELVEELTEARTNSRRLPGIRLHDNLRFSSDAEAAAAGSEAAFLAVPSRHLQQVLAGFPDLPAIISCVKGFGAHGLERMTQVISRGQPDTLTAALSGPNLAAEVAAGKPAAAVVASASAELGKKVQGWLRGPNFRAYSSDDVAGVEIGGAIKNVIALATGMSSELQLGDNTKATIITRGLHELVRLGTLLGGRRETFYGLSGLGDMVATCAGPQSRNFLAGSRLARGEDLATLEREGLTAEGIGTVRRVVEYASGQGLDLPICSEVHAVIFERKSPADAISALMERSSKAESAVY